MLSPYRYSRLRLQQAGLLPMSKTALVTWYLLGLDVVLFALQKALGAFKLPYGDGLGGWVTFLSFVAIPLFTFLFFRWAKTKVLWRLRNRLIVTYVFIGVIPVVLLVGLALGSFYLFAGQFATYIVTTGLNSELAKLDAANSAITHQVAAQMQRHPGAESVALESLRQRNEHWADRQICIWLNRNLLLNSLSGDATGAPLSLPSHLKNSFHEVVRDHNQLFLRAMETVPLGTGTLTVISSEPLGQRMLQGLAADLGQITLYEGLSREIQQTAGGPTASLDVSGQSARSKQSITIDNGKGQRYVLDTSKAVPVLTAGSIPPPTSRLDLLATFPTAVYIVNWETGDTSNPVGISVQTRVSRLYERLFAAQGDFAPVVEIIILIALVVFAVIEFVAIGIGYHLTRTVTGAVDHLYDGTQHVNRGDFAHRIPVRSHDQIATLANAFNSMTASLEKLIEEQKEKQRLENELVIAQEVQAQLFPRQVSQLASLEVHGFCRPARTVSGDYYDFLKLDSEKLILAVGDISGKGISAALLMATIHSAVRAYGLQDIPVLREPVAVGAALNANLALPSALSVADLSPGLLLSLLNHQLYASTPAEKYATLFLGVYSSKERTLNYSNGGHLPPIVMSTDGGIRKLEAGGMVVGLFDDQSYEEGSVQLRSGDILLAYSDGVTEPENDFGEFGEERLVDLLRENRDLPLERISEIVTAAVDDWIGANEQPDDITLVLARAR
jgi:sigma-B regulation protein RsbU (phosphoserine phosphatase)